MCHTDTFHHTAIHTGETPFTCISNFVRCMYHTDTFHHTAIHTGETPFTSYGHPYWGNTIHVYLEVRTLYCVMLIRFIIRPSILGKHHSRVSGSSYVVMCHTHTFHHTAIHTGETPFTCISKFVRCNVSYS